MSTFICRSCGEELPSRALGAKCLEESGVRTRKEAIEFLSEPVCYLCEQEGVLDDSQDTPGIGERSEQELFEFSGIMLSPGMETFVAMNW